VPRGFLGIEVEADQQGVRIKSVLTDSTAQRAGLRPGDALASVNERFGMLGYGIVAVFMACWIGSVLFHRWKRPAIAAR